MMRRLLILLTACLSLLSETVPAAGQFKKAITPGQYDDQVTSMFAQHRWDKGKEVLDEGLDRYPNDPNLHYLAGRYWYHIKNYDRARFHNSIRANYQGYSQNVSETVLLRKQKSVVIPEEKPNVPDPETFFGKLESISQIVVNNPDRNDYWYGLLAHEQGGDVIPGIWSKSGEIRWFKDQRSYASAANLNGCAYEHKSGRWVPVHAWDSPDLLQYDTAEGSNADNQSYLVAMQWNWDEGRKVNGHPSVTTSRITITMSNGVVTAVDSSTGASLGSWTYKQ